MLEKLAGIEARYQEINRMLMEVGDDYQRAAELGIERAELEPLVSKAGEYRELLGRRDEAQALLDGEDADLHQLAEAELIEVEPQIEELEREINQSPPQGPSRSAQRDC